YFFFSSRRRHTRFSRDWSSDVCSSDLYRIGREDDSQKEVEFAIRIREFAGTYMEHCHNTQHEDTSMLLRWDSEHPGQVQLMPTRSEERRVGKECRTRWAT